MEPRKLRGTISYDGEVVAYCVKGKNNKIEELVEKVEKYPRAKELLEEVLSSNELNERMKGRIEEFLDN